MPVYPGAIQIANLPHKQGYNRFYETLGIRSGFGGGGSARGCA
jgi:hypothetical protein